MMQGYLFALVLLLLPAFHASAREPKTAHEMLQADTQEILPRYLLAGPDGQAVSNEDFRGRFQLIAFGYTFCPDICPTTLVEMAEILRLLGEQSGQVRAIFISVDPERDTPQILKVYTAFFDPRIIGLTGSSELVKRAARNFKVRYAKVIPTSGDSKNYAVDHAAGMFLIGQDGLLVKKFAYGAPVNEVLAEIRRFLPVE